MHFSFYLCVCVCLFMCCHLIFVMSMCNCLYDCECILLNCSWMDGWIDGCTNNWMVQKYGIGINSYELHFKLQRFFFYFGCFFSRIVLPCPPYLNCTYLYMHYARACVCSFVRYFKVALIWINFRSLSVCCAAAGFTFRKEACIIISCRLIVIRLFYFLNFTFSICMRFYVCAIVYNSYARRHQIALL